MNLKKKEKKKRVNIFPFITFIRNLRVKIDHSLVSGVKSAHLKQMCSQSDTDWVAVAMLIPEPGFCCMWKELSEKGGRKKYHEAMKSSYHEINVDFCKHCNKLIKVYVSNN